MMEAVVHANRMMLMKLQKRLAMARRGHTLMKHKLEELVHLFQQEVKDFNEFRTRLEKELQLNYTAFVVGMGLFRGEYLHSFLATPFIHVSMEKKQVHLLNLKVPHYQVKIEMETPPYSLMETNSDIDGAVQKGREIILRMIELAQRQRRIELLSREIKITRRRVNALEFELIPSIEQQVAYIKLKLDEAERGDINRLMRIKSIIRKQK